MRISSNYENIDLSTPLAQKPGFLHASVLLFCLRSLLKISSVEFDQKSVLQFSLGKLHFCLVGQKKNGQVCVMAMDEEASHGVAASEDCVSELFEGLVEGALPDEGRAVFVHSCRVAVVSRRDTSARGSVTRSVCQSVGSVCRCRAQNVC